jgi:hypothetical protein
MDLLFDSILFEGFLQSSDGFFALCGEASSSYDGALAHESAGGGGDDHD